MAPLKTSDGTAYQYSQSSSQLANYLAGVSNTNPGVKVTGTIAFEIPQSATPTARRSRLKVERAKARRSPLVCPAGVNERRLPRGLGKKWHRAA
ncbi:MAG TPA: DUF4352 domain-containing protein [Candidatus Bathyarchaeia archaeon]|nr:DUF4352 domain-containing protein [Candidatus Bathyarchaeia archaeon]